MSARVLAFRVSMYQYLTLTKQRHLKKNLFVACKDDPQTIFFPIEPKLTVLKLSPVVRSFKGYEATWSVTGPPPIYTALIHNSTVLFNTTTTTGIFKLENDGNYTFVATNRFATDVKEFSVVVTGKTIVIF